MRVKVEIRDIPTDLVKPILRLALERDVEPQDVVIACLRYALSGRKYRVNVAKHLRPGEPVAAPSVQAERAAAVARRLDDEAWEQRKRAEYLRRAGLVAGEIGRQPTDAEVRGNAARAIGKGHWLFTEHAGGTPAEWMQAAGVGR